MPPSQTGVVKWPSKACWRSQRICSHCGVMSFEILVHRRAGSSPWRFVESVIFLATL